ncbi:MAG: hypothetical protein RhofKO_01910 [Rhodothermales bacterium]
MHTGARRWLFLGWLLGTLLPSAAWAQNPVPDSLASNQLRVYVDCGRCDRTHIRAEIDLVTYVRDPEQADVHLFITDQRTGSGGRQYELSFLGREAFASVEYTFTHVVDRDATTDERREAINDAIRAGLMPYVLQREPLSAVEVTYAQTEGEAAAETVQNDPWKHWVFTVYIGDIELELESNRTVFDSRWGIFADHVTDDWKLRFRPYFNYDFVRIEREENEDVTSSISRHGVESFAIKSLGPHWSAGLFAEYITRNDRNLKHEVQVLPGVEYSILPYDEATRRAITVVYQVGTTYVDYFEQTIFDKTQETLFNQRLRASVAIRQPWGNIFSGLEASHYFHDFTKRRAEFFGSLNVRLFEGLSLEVSGEFEMIQDQLALPKGDATIEDILLRQRELATDFVLSGSIGLSYSFGSEFANVVNTRF